MTTVSLCPIINFERFLTNAGVLANGCFIYAYEAGSTSILQNTYTDNTGSTPNSNPIVLDSTGKPSTAVWLDSTLAYNLVFTLSDGITVVTSLDNVRGVGNVQSVAAVAPASGFTITGSPITGSGTLTFALSDDLAAIEGLSSNGVACRTGPAVWAARTITAGSGVTVTNGDGVAGNPTIGLQASSSLISGMLIDYAGNSVPAGWLACDGSAVSRTTYSDLFTAIATTYGAGDGSTTFNVPDFRCRVSIGSGSGVTTESVTTSTSNGFNVVANNSKWLSGMPVYMNSLSGFTTSAVAGGTYYIYRASSTNVRLCSTLALAENGTPDIAISGSGAATFSYYMTTRTVTEQGGEEGHAMTLGELVSHLHQMAGGSPVLSGGSTDLGIPGSGGTNTQVYGSPNTTYAGGGSRSSYMPAFVVVTKMIKT